MYSLANVRSLACVKSYSLAYANVVVEVNDKGIAAAGSLTLRSSMDLPSVALVFAGIFFSALALLICNAPVCNADSGFKEWGGGGG